jgi:nicotinamidase-related amidase
VIYIQHHDQIDPALQPGRPGFAIRAAIAPQPGETVLVKRICDTFTGTNLEQVLREAGIERLVTCGIQSDFCVDAAMRGAMNRGFGVTLAGDAHTTWDNGVLCAEQIIAHVNATLPNMSGPGPRMQVRPASKVAFGHT